LLTTRNRLGRQAAISIHLGVEEQMPTVVRNGMQVIAETGVSVVLFLVSATALYVSVATGQTRLMPFLLVALFLASFMVARKVIQGRRRAAVLRADPVTE
jgi:K+-transporting ATPase A subunit